MYVLVPTPVSHQHTRLTSPQRERQRRRHDVDNMERSSSAFRSVQLLHLRMVALLAGWARGRQRARSQAGMCTGTPPERTRTGAALRLPAANEQGWLYTICPLLNDSLDAHISIGWCNHVQCPDSHESAMRAAQPLRQYKCG